MGTVLLCTVVGVIAYYVTKIFEAGMSKLGHFLWKIGIR